MGLKLLQVVWASGAMVALAGHGVAADSFDPSGRWVHKAWGPERGLPDDRVKDIAQTADGYLWLGTSRGLARFDGVRFTVFNRSNVRVFNSDECWSLAVDGQDVLWIGTPNGLLSFRQGEFHSFGSKEGLTDPFIATVYAGPTTGVWVGTMEGLSRYNHGKWETIPVAQGGLTARVTRIHEDHTGKVWLGTARGVQILDPQTHVLAPAALPRHHHQTNFVAGIYTHTNGVVWISYLCDGGKSEFVEVRDGQVREITNRFVHLPGETLLGMAQGTRLWHPAERWQTWKWLAQEPGSALRMPVAPLDVLWALFEDRDGCLWMGTENSGVHRFSAAPHRMEQFHKGLPDPTVWATAEDPEGRVWLGTDKGLVRKSGEQVTVFGKDQGLSDTYVRALALDALGRLWIGTTDGLSVMDRGRLQPVPIPGRGLARKVRAILCASDGSLWLGTDAGVFHRAGHDAWTSLTGADGFADERAPVLLEGAEGEIWIGTVAGGLYRWADGRLTRFKTQDGLPSDHITALFRDSSGLVWVGTDHGIARWESGTWKVSLGAADGPIDTAVRGLVEDDAGFFWIYCAAGLYGARRQDLLRQGGISPEQFIHRFPLEGPWIAQSSVPKSQPLIWKTRDGQVLFGSSEGLWTIHPREYQRRSPAPAVVIEQVIAAGETRYANSPIGFDGRVAPKRAPLSGPLRLAPREGDHLEIHFTEPALANADQVRFKYQLEGVESEWVEGGSRRSAHYTGLGPGLYAFRVMAGDSYADWPESMTRLEFSVAPRLHQAAWFRWGALLAGSAIGYGLIRWRLREAQQRQEWRRALAVTAERTRLARDLHDQLGAEITRAARLSERLDGVERPQWAAEKSRLRESLRAMRQRIDAAVWSIAPEKDRLSSLIDFIADRAQSLLDGTGVELELHLPEANSELALPPEFRHELATAVLEAVNNALRHGRPQRVQLTVQLAQGRLTLEVADDGVGFDSAGLLRLAGAPTAHASPRSGASRSRAGLNGMRARVQSLGGDFQIASQPGRGTRVTLRVPVPHCNGVGSPE